MLLLLLFIRERLGENKRKIHRLIKKKTLFPNLKRATNFKLPCNDVKISS